MEAVRKWVGLESEECKMKNANCKLQIEQQAVAHLLPPSILQFSFCILQFAISLCGFVGSAARG